VSARLSYHGNFARPNTQPRAVCHKIAEVGAYLNAALVRRLLNKNPI